MKKRAALINPHDPLYHREREMLNRISGVEGIENFPHLGLLSVGAYFDDSWEVEYIDEDRLAQKNLPRDYLDKNFDLVLLSAMNHQAFQAYRIADHFRKRGIPTAMGGIHASSLPEEASLHADTVIAGEGEQVMEEFLQDFLRGAPRKIYRSPNDMPLEEMRPPRFEAVEDLSWYNKISLFATRGCPRACRFCCLKTVYGHRYRKKTPTQVVREIEMVKKLYPNPFISFADENMLADAKWSKSLAEALIPLKIKWEAYSDISVAKDPELLSLLARSGCVELLIGFETLSPESMKEADQWKVKQIKDYGKNIKKIQDAGIGVLACFVVGFDGDNKDTFSRIKEFLRENPVFELDAASLTPMPGTPLYRQLEKEGRIFSRRWDQYTWYHVNFQPMHLTGREINEGIAEIFRFYNSREMAEKRERLFTAIEERIGDFSGRNAARPAEG